jgi:cytochrome c peroxidase
MKKRGIRAIEVARSTRRAWMLFVAAVLAVSPVAADPPADAAPPPIGERPAVEEHLEQSAIDAGEVSLGELFDHGALLFDARFNTLDGQGRPATTGGGAPRVPDQPAFIRTSAPDSSSCAGCHAQPRSGGAGDFVANVFVLAQVLDPVTESVSAHFSNERNTLGMMGAGPIEMVAREMSAELIAIREAAHAEAQQTGLAVTRDLVAKGVSFGRITVLPDGKVDPTEIDGVDWDLIVKPFHQKGAVVSLREFSNNAMNHHHGMQAMERFGADVDFDQDGVMNELTAGDITAVTIYQAALNTPGEVIPRHPAVRRAVERGRELFDAVECTSCHLPRLTLNDPVFSEPNPYNPPGNLRPADVPEPFRFDMTREGPKPRLESSPQGGAVVRAFTDLKRHDLCDDDFEFFANEQVVQGSLVGFASPDDFTVPPQPRPLREFLTRKLWDVGNTAPYGHRGDLTMITDAIYFHGGDARESRDAFFALAQEERDSIIEFLKTLQVLPRGSARVVSGPPLDESDRPHGRRLGRAE